MSFRILEFNFETNALSLASNEGCGKEYNEFIQCINIPHGNFYVMRVNGICCSDNEFRLVSKTEFHDIVSRYIEEFEITPKEIGVSHKNFVLENLNVEETSYAFNADLCSFTLYNIV